jgi:hypothetical protein
VAGFAFSGTLPCGGVAGAGFDAGCWAWLGVKRSINIAESPKVAETIRERLFEAPAGTSMKATP